MTVSFPTAAEPVVVIAELSGNHNGSKARALELVHAAKEAGADVVKLQTYTADTITMDAPGEWFTIHGGPWDGRRLYDLYGEASTPWEWHADLFAEAARVGLRCFSTPFDPTAVDFLETLAVPWYKVASFEVVDIPLLQRIAATRKPVIMSAARRSMKQWRRCAPGVAQRSPYLPASRRIRALREISGCATSRTSPLAMTVSWACPITVSMARRSLRPSRLAVDYGKSICACGVRMAGRIAASV